ncbi:hypothetical protein [Amaricoccus solimangrovi]|uniref:Lipoprotein n=1 Tax=Amaricoccus solimangrovi TaxID=2589815 RepID=A0A501X149_9RHOB|nr:hypothetical protein [Amaricoccus solimangrovi]TPE53106.1 hypothetical protein FJM51_03530 [Amaricoccus solimangrovi]
MRSFRLVLLGCVAATGLAACAQITPVTDADRQTPNRGGSAGQMGPGYCQTLPADVSDRMQWNQLCFPND